MNSNLRRAMRLAAYVFPFALVVVVLVASAQAAPIKKVYEAYVIPVTAPSNGPGAAGSETFLVTLQNDAKSQQGIGSANYTAPNGWTLTGVTNVSAPAGKDWSETCIGNGITCGAPGNVLQFRSGSSADALAAGLQVTATVTANITCPVAHWFTTEVKQSNDFSGQPGNDFTLNGAGSDLDPLGGFTISTIGNPQLTGEYTLQVGVPWQTQVTALDTCGGTKQDYPKTPPYAGATVTPNDPSNVTASAIQWNGAGVGTTNVTGSVGESGNTITVTEPNAQAITQTSTPPFTTLDTVCDKNSVQCSKTDNSSGINVSGVNPAGNATLGLGFNKNLSSLACGAFTPKGQQPSPFVDPQGYAPGSVVVVTIVYPKNLTGSGSPNSFPMCIYKPLATNPVTYQVLGPLQNCPSTAFGNNCILGISRTSNGALKFQLQLDPFDPYPAY